MEKEKFEDLIYKVIGALIEVHKELGPGLLESVYRRSLEIELELLNIKYESEKDIILEYKGKIAGNHRLDLLIEKELIVELKAVEVLDRKHYSQVRSYLKAMNKNVGLLVNFADFSLDHRRVERKLN